jgi:ketosteroid isomerase-like protein
MILPAPDVPMRALLLSLMLCCSAVGAQDVARSHAHAVREFVAASNRQDVDAMLAATVEDFRWVQVVGEQATTEVQGHNDLRSWLEAYFASTPGAHAEIGPVQVHGAFASAIETASWTGKDGARKAQSATSVYEFAPDGRIRYVWYFNAQPAPVGAEAATP